MFRSLLALAVRSFREDTRSLLPHVFRLLFAAFILLTLIYAHLQSARLGAPGKQFFSLLCWLNFLFISVGAASVFATPITEEKEEATLGLLRMAGINPFGLLIGKSSTRLFMAVLILAIQLPYTLLAITLGGVLWGQIFAAYVSLLAYLVLAAQVGLLCSVICSRSSSAATLSGVLLGAFLIGPPIVKESMRGAERAYPLLTPVWGAVRNGCDVLMEATIWRSLTSVLSSDSGDVAWFQVWTNVTAAVVLFVVAGLTFDYFTRSQLIAAPSRGSLFRMRIGMPRTVRWLSAGRTWDQALIWKEFHFVTGGFGLLIGRFLAYFSLIVGLSILVKSLDAPATLVEIFARVAVMTMLLLGGIEMAIYCSRMFREELRWQTFSALLMLPTGMGSMAWSKLAGCLLAWFPAVFWLAMGISLDAREMGWELRHELERTPFLPIFLVMQYVVFLHLVTWTSLVSKWGALPLSFVISYPISWTLIGGTISAFRIGPGSDGNAFFFVMCCFATMAIGALQVGIWYQLNVHAERA